jgi:hypothetical protein
MQQEGFYLEKIPLTQHAAHVESSPSYKGREEPRLPVQMDMNMEYKGFVAKYYYSRVACHFVGEISNVPDVISFGATTLIKLQEVMIDAVENYLKLNSRELEEVKNDN